LVHGAVLIKKILILEDEEGKRRVKKIRHKEEDDGGQGGVVQVWLGRSSWVIVEVVLKGNHDVL